MRNNARRGVGGAVPLVIAAVLAMLASPARAQTTGRLIGVIDDAQGAVLPGVTVTATSPQLQGANVSVTDGAGQYRFPALPPGVYTVKAELSGFRPADLIVGMIGGALAQPLLVGSTGPPLALLLAPNRAL